MTRERYVALALAHVRSPWSTDVARWSTAGALPLELVKCLSVSEVRARLSSGRSSFGLSTLPRSPPVQVTTSTSTPSAAYFAIVAAPLLDSS